MTEILEEIIEVQEDLQVDDIRYTEIQDPYGFIYITTNLINGKKYLGQKSFDDKWKKYIGSGVAFKRAVDKYGQENFNRNIIDIAYSKDELNKKEYEYSVHFNVVESYDWYNIVLGGGATNGFHHSQETKQKLRDFNLGKKMDDETKRKIAKSLSITMTGRKFSDEHKRHISESREGLNNPGYRVVYCVELNEIFWSAKAVEDKYGIDNGSICKCCRGLRKTIGKHPITNIPLTWKYANDFIKDNCVVIPGAITLGYITQAQVDEYLNTLK